jgi:cathepsin L
VTGSDGMYQEYQIPYISYYGTDYDCSTAKTLSQPVATISDYVKLPNNDYDSVMNAIATVGPLAINVDASTWHAYESGIFDGCNDAQPDVNHVVVLMGYGEEDGQMYWSVRNSWSAAYGEAGYIRLARQVAAEEPCGTDVTPTDGVECEADDTPVEVCGTCGAIYDSSYPLNAVVF